MKVNIKNMVCPCCQLYVKNLVRELGLEVHSVSMGEVVLAEPATEEQLALLDEQLREAGLELIHDDRYKVIEKMKLLMNDLVNQNGDASKLNFSAILSDRLQYNYSYLSAIFSKAEGTTIRDYCIQLRIQSVKRMLLNEGLDLAQIASVLNYSSVAHLAAQFKKVTGMTSSEFKRAYSRSAQVPMMG